MPRPLKDNPITSTDVPRRLDFWDPLPEELHNSDLNPYVKEYFRHGLPVVVGREAKQYKGNWQECFGRKAPISLEIGSGNGFFLEGMAQKNPDHNWLGIEIRYKRVIMVAKRKRVSKMHAFFDTTTGAWTICLKREVSRCILQSSRSLDQRRQAHKRILAKPLRTLDGVGDGGWCRVAHQNRF